MGYIDISKILKTIKDLTRQLLATIILAEDNANTYLKSSKCFGGPMKTRKTFYFVGAAVVAGIIVGALGGILLPYPRYVGFIGAEVLIYLLGFFLLATRYLTPGWKWYRTWIGWSAVASALTMLACYIVILVY